MNTAVVSISGAYWTGSSAYIDLIREFKNNRIIDVEYKLFGFGELFKDLENNICKDYAAGPNYGPLDTYSAFNKYDYYPLRGMLRRIAKKFDWYPYILFSNRSSLSQKFGSIYNKNCKKLHKYLANNDVKERNIIIGLIEEIFRSIPRSGPVNNIIFDQMISPVFYDQSKQYFKKLKCLNVDRDWRDQYISMRDVYHQMLKVNNAVKIHPWDEDYTSLLSMGPVEYFINLRRKISACKNSHTNDSNVCWLYFEDLVYDKNKTVSKLADFLEISINDWSEHKHFFENESKLRTKKWRNISNPIILNELDIIGSCLEEMPYLDVING